MKKLITSTLLIAIVATVAMAQGSSAIILNNGAADELTNDPTGFFNKFTEGESLKFEFRAGAPTPEETEEGVNFAVQATIVLVGETPKIIANSKKVIKRFKAGDALFPNQIFEPNDLLFSNAVISKLMPGKYRLVVSMSVANLHDRTKYKTARKAFDFVWK